MLTVLYGTAVLLTGLVRLQRMADSLRTKQGRWYISAIGAFVSIISGAVILRNPFASTSVLWIFTGAVILCVVSVLASFTLYARFYHRLLSKVPCK